MMPLSAARSLAMLAAFGLLFDRSSGPAEDRLSVDSVPLGGTPFAVAIAPSGVTYVTQASGGSVARAERPQPPFSMLVPVGPLPCQVRMSPEGRTAYVGNQNAGTVTFVNVETSQPFDTVAVPAGSILTIGLSPGGERVYALTDYHGVYVIDALDRVVIDSIPASETGHILTGVAFHPTASRMYVAARDAGKVTVIDTDADTVVKTYAVDGGRIQNVAVARDGSELYGTDIQRSGLVIWNLRSGRPEYIELLIGSGQVRNAFDVAVTPNNRRLYVSTLADGKVYIVDRATRMGRGSIATGGSPRYIAFDRTGTRAVIPNEMGWVNFIH
jgi:YVTN family beta-propeller protein